MNRASHVKYANRENRVRSAKHANRDPSADRVLNARRARNVLPGPTARCQPRVLRPPKVHPAMAQLANAADSAAAVAVVVAAVVRVAAATPASRRGGEMR